MSTPTTACLLDVSGLSRHLSDAERKMEVRVEQLRLNPGSLVSFVGESGIGKSTALELLALAQIPDKWTHFSIRDVQRTLDLSTLFENHSHSALAALRRRLFGYAIQTARLMPFLNVAENARLCQKLNADKDEEFLGYVLDGLGLTDLRMAYPDDLSVGQKQRVAIARAIAHKPQLIMLDEPTSALDPDLGLRVLDFIAFIGRELGAAIILVTHNVDAARQIGFEPMVFESVRSGDRMVARFYQHTRQWQPASQSPAETWP